MKEKDTSEQSTPKRVRFHEGVKGEVEPLNLKTRLENQQQLDRNTGYADNKNQYTKEITKDEYESKYNPPEEYNPNTYFGRRLRSNERVQPEDPSIYNRNIKNEYEVEEPARTPIQKLAQSTYATSGRQTPPRSFQLKNIVNNTEYVRKKLPEGTNEK